jgi:hypothetical protein
MTALGFKSIHRDSSTDVRTAGGLPVPIQRVTRESLKRSPRHHLEESEQRYAEHLLELAEKRPWYEIERRKAAEYQTKAWAIEKGTWRF